MNDDIHGRYYVRFGAAFARGRLALREEDDEALFRAGQARGLKMHKFKRAADLPRVRRVIAMLKGLVPESLLDVGSGRGVFLWPLLDALPELAVTAIDQDELRASDLAAITRGGLTRLASARMDATSLSFGDGAFDGVTILEVLEHLVDPSRAAREVMRVARRFVVASVPSKPDDNPEHIHLFDVPALRRMFVDAGARDVRVEHVLNHAVVLAMKP
jgi:ubiquinone/menaquinone biosynthesis C-methylase UbiE